MDKKDKLTEGLKPLKILTDETSLPYVFDLHWDIKTGSKLKSMKTNSLVRRLLAEHGFDVKKWLEE